MGKTKVKMAIIVPKKLDRARLDAKLDIGAVDSGEKRSDGGSKLPGCIISRVKGKLKKLVEALIS